MLHPDDPASSLYRLDAPYSKTGKKDKTGKVGPGCHQGDGTFGSMPRGRWTVSLRLRWRWAFDLQPVSPPLLFHQGSQGRDQF
jgi:hypothetical protein